nr:MAG TPA: hypothetical protein [Caudoviricetes sp.]
MVDGFVKLLIKNNIYTFVVCLRLSVRGMLYYQPTEASL